MATVSTVPAVDAIIKAVMKLLKDVIEKEDNCQILQTDFKPLENLVQDIGIFFRFRQKEAPEMVKIWLQLLHNSLTEAKGLLDQPRGRRQRCLDSVLCNPGRLSEKIRAWKAFFNHLFERFESDWFDHIPLAGNTINTHMVDPVIKLLEGVINKEDNRQILQTDHLRLMENLVQDIATLFRDEPDITTLFQRQKRELLKIVKNWLQLLENSVTEADGLLDRSARRRIFGDPRSLSKEIGDWRASFHNIYDSIQSELSILVTSPEFILSKQLYEKEIFHQEAATSSEFGGSGFMEARDQVEQWLNEGDHVRVIGVIHRAGKTHLLQLLYDKYKNNVEVSDVFEHVILISDTQNYEISDLQKRIAGQIPELQGSSADEITGELPDRLPDEILELVEHILPRIADEITGELQDRVADESSADEITGELQYHVPDEILELVELRGPFGHEILPRILAGQYLELQESSADEITGELQDRVADESSADEITGEFQDRVADESSADEITGELQDRVADESSADEITGELQDRVADESSADESSELQESSTDEIKGESQDRVADEIDLSLKLSAYLKEKNFLLLLDDLWSRIDLQEVGVAFGDGKHSKVVFSTRRKELIPEMSAQQSTEIQPLSEDERWKLFRRVAFKDEQVSVEIEERARMIANKCKGLPVAVNVVAAAMVGKSSVHEWDNCLSSIQKVEATHPRLDAQLYPLLRYAYDSLPNSQLKSCFLYHAMYKQDEGISTFPLLQKWIGEGLVKSKQGSYLMDMAIGNKYLKLIVDRCLFQRGRQTTQDFEWNTVRVEECIRDMAVYIGQREENCLFMASQNQRNFPEVPNENCCRISLDNNLLEDLPSHELRCPKLASLTLSNNRQLKELPSGFLSSVTSLRVLDLWCCTKITSVPESIGQLKMLEFLSLSALSIKDLPEEICHLCRLQVLHVSNCRYLESFPSTIGQLQNLRVLYSMGCESLQMIPRDISELASLSSLVLSTFLSVEKEAPASIWSLKGLQNLTELRVRVEPSQRGTKSAFKDGIMGTWSEMRHLELLYPSNISDEIMENLPQDMQNMKKLQSFRLWNYKGLSLPNCEYEHLEMVQLYGCNNMTELSRLEWMPNLKLLKLRNCKNLRELGIGSRGGVPSGYLKLQKLVLKDLEMLESLAGPSNSGVWDERTLPELRVLKIRKCRSLKRFPNGMEKVPNLSAILGYPGNWWKSIIWENNNLKMKLEEIFKEYLPTQERNR